MRYELTDCEWSVIKPMLPNKPAASLEQSTGAFSTVSIGSCGLERLGRRT
jgi:transposase